MLFNISGLVRHNVSVFWKFIGVEGIKVIVNSLKSNNEKLMIKSAFLIYSTCHMGNDIVGQLMIYWSNKNTYKYYTYDLLSLDNFYTLMLLL